MKEVVPSAATDVTGYGFLGHLSEMLEVSGVGAVVRRSEIPVWEKAETLAADGCYPGGLKNNRITSARRSSRTAFLPTAYCRSTIPRRAGACSSGCR